MLYDKRNSCVTEGNIVTWKDLVCVKGKVYAEEFPIENGVDPDENGEPAFRIDMFLGSVAEKYGCDPDEVVTWTMEGDGFDEGADLPEDFYWSGALAFGCAECGAYINGEPAEDVLARG